MAKSFSEILVTGSDAFKQCSTCKIWLSLSDFYSTTSTLSGRKAECKQCTSVLTSIRERAKREHILQHYGGQCCCCGEARYEFLAIDHLEGGGNQHRKQIGNKIYRWLRRNNLPEGFQVLCHNCNMAKGFYGQCPHVTEVTVNV